VSGNLDTLHTAVTAAATQVGNQIVEHLDATNATDAATVGAI
jgi:hypothetical protein